MSDRGAAPAVRRRDAAIFGAVIIASLALVGVLWALARDADSAGVSGSITGVELPDYSASEVCANWATYWTTDSGVNAPPGALEAMSNCRQTSDGGWIVATNAADVRLLRPVVLSDEQHSRIANIEAAIMSQLGRFDRSMSDDLEQHMARIYDPSIKGVAAHLRDGERIGDARQLYEKELFDYLEQPGTQELSSYIAWAMSYRQAAFAQFMDACGDDDLQYLALTCDGTGDSLSVNHIPWIWDLRSSLLLDAYLLGVATGEIPSPPGYEITGPVTDDTSAS